MAISYPVIIFRINLETVNSLTDRTPYNLSTEGSNFPLTRSTWFPNHILANYQIKHGEEITVSGVEALYLYNQFTSGPFKFLDVVSFTGGTFISSSSSFSSSSYSSSSSSRSSSSFSSSSSSRSSSSSSSSSG